MKRASPIGGELEGSNGSAEGSKSRDLEELVDLLVAIKDSAFSRLMFGVEGGSTGLPEFQNRPSDGKEDFADTRMHTLEEEKNEEDHPDDRPRSGWSANFIVS